SLVAAGWRVVAYVRRPERLPELSAVGINPVSAMDDIADCSLVISMLPDGAAVADVVSGLTRRLARRAIHRSMRTISPQCSTDMAAVHAHYGQGYVAAPVFGNPDAARLASSLSLPPVHPIMSPAVGRFSMFSGKRYSS